MLRLMIVKRTSVLPLPAAEACALAQKPALFQHVVWPVFTTGPLPERLDVGAEAAARLYFLGVLPAWTHRVRLVELEPTEIATQERGGPVRTWNHRLTFEPVGERACRYTDEIEIHAGPATLATAAFARLMFRWRHRRWRTLARVLA